jgi:O-antigen/teichoic acid export membrane protein
MGASQIVGKVAGFVLFAILARQLGEVVFGQYAAAIALVSLFAVLIEFGTSGYLVREGAQRPGDIGEILGHILALRVVLGIATVLLALPVGLALGYDRATLIAVVLFTFASALRVGGGVFLSTLQALEHLGDVAAVQAQMAVLQAAMVGGAAIAGFGLIGISWALVLASAVVPVYSWLRLRRRWKGKVRMRLSAIVSTLKATRAFAAAAAMFMALTYLDTVMIQGFKGNAATGLYGAAYRILLALGFIPTIYNEAVLRSISRLGKEDRAAMTRLYARSVKHLVMFAVPVALGGALLSGPILRAVVGAQYAPAATAQAILLSSLLVAFPGWVSVTTAYAVHRERSVMWMLAIVVVANVGVNFFAIPRWGIEGAAAATVGAELLLFAMLLAILAREEVRPKLAAAYARPLIAGAVMVAAIWPLRHAPVWLPVAVGAVVYSAVVLVLHGVDREDLEFARGAFRRGGGDIRSELEP